MAGRLLLGLGAPAILACALFGSLAGAGAVTVVQSGATSYLSDDPKACVNCHIMREQYDGWQKGSHHAVAVCIDCHLPQGFFDKYYTKAENGYRHGKLFTTQTFAEPIVVQARGREVLEANCVRCHASLVADLSPESSAGHEGISCVRCHSNVGHGETARLGGRLTQAELERIVGKP